MLKFFILVVILSSAIIVHPLHVSVCEIEYDAESKALEIVQRIFIDDLEKQIRLDLGLPELDITQPGDQFTTDQLVQDYLVKRLRFVINGKQATHTYLGHEIEGDAMFCYIEVEKVKKLKSLKVQSTILSDIYDDQVNLIHVEVDNKMRSMKLTSKNREEEFKYD